jgi:putative ABC transport system substrate-binding protein
MKRREFISLLGGAVAWPVTVRAQQSGMRRIGALMAATPDDPETQARLAAFAQGLQRLSWTLGQNVHVDYRFGGSDADSIRKHAEAQVALYPDVILANSSAAVSPLLKLTRSVPIVFTTVADPVGAGYVASLAHPSGNSTGFTNFEYAIGGKWLQLLKEVAPSVTRAAVLRESAIAAGPGQFGAVQTAAASLGVELHPVEAGDVSEIESGISAFADYPNGGLIVTGSPAASVHRALIIALAARHRLPAVYNAGFYVADGGLISYGPDFIDQFRGAAGYVDRILRGEKPADLPVQAPTKYETVINLQTARELALDLPRTLLARADEVIE